MFGNKNKKYIERAGEILAQLAKKNLSKVQPVDEAAKSLIPTKENLERIEKKFDINRLEMIYYLLKRRYIKRVNFPLEIESNIMGVKKIAHFTDQGSLEHSKSLLVEIRKGLIKLEKAISKIDKNYERKL